MSVIAISFLIVGCSALLVAVAAIYKQHSRVIFWSGAVALFLALCFLFATGIFKPEAKNTMHNAALMGVSVLMLVISYVFVIAAEDPKKLLRKKKQTKDVSAAVIGQPSVNEKPEEKKEMDPSDSVELIQSEASSLEEELPDGVIIPKELDTPLARKVFAKAIELDLMKEDGHHYRWSERESKVLLAYMCGRIYCGDTPDYNEQKRKDYWMPGKWSVFPDTALNNLFQMKDLAISRTNRLYDAAPFKSAMIDGIIDQYKDVFPKSN